MTLAMGRSAVSNGKRHFLNRTRNSPEARRLRDILNQLFNDRGGIESLSIEAQSSCRVFAGLCVQQEVILGKLAAGEAVDSSDLARMAYALERARRAMGDPPPKHPTPRRGRVISTSSGAGAPPVGETSP